MIVENLSTLKIHKLTQEQYDRELEAKRIDENALYLTPTGVTPIEEGGTGATTAAEALTNLGGVSNNALISGSITVAKAENAENADMATSLKVLQASFGNGIDVATHSVNSPIWSTNISSTNCLLVFKFSTNTANLPHFTSVSAINTNVLSAADCISLPYQVSPNGFVLVELINGVLYFTPHNIAEGDLALRSITVIPFN